MSSRYTSPRLVLAEPPGRAQGYPFETDLPRDGFGGRPCTAGFARYGPDPPPLWGEVPASRLAGSRVLGLLPNFRVSPRLGHRLSAPRAASRSRRPRRPAAQGGPVGRLRGAAPRRRHAERWEVSPRQTCSVPPTAALCTISAAGTPPTVFGSRAPVRSRALAPSAGGSRRVPFSSVASLLAELGQRGGSRAGARGCRRVGSRPYFVFSSQQEIAHKVGAHCTPLHP